MYKFMSGNLLDSDAHALCNTVNCFGVMGKGVALEFKRRYPDCLPAYERACKDSRGVKGNGTLRAGMILPWSAPDGHLVLHCATKFHYWNDSQMVWIDAILERLVANYQRLSIRSIAIPPMGCGNGGLQWSEVRPRIVRASEQMDIPVFIYGAER